MELTLRAAHKLVDKITQQIHAIQINPIATINVFDVDNDSDVVEHLYQDRMQEFEDKIARVEDLMTIRTFIRDTIRAINEREGINQLVSERKDVVDRAQLLGRLVSVLREQYVSTPEALQRQIARAQEAAGESYRADVVNFSLISNRERMEHEIAGYRRQAETIEDALLHKNLANTLVLPQTHVIVLSDEKLI